MANLWHLCRCHTSHVSHFDMLLMQVPALQLNNERFQVPELIFSPGDVGMQQAGLAEAVVEAANAVHPDLRPLLFSNVVCTGGTSTCPGFQDRLFKDLRQLVPTEYEVPMLLHIPLSCKFAFVWQVDLFQLSSQSQALQVSMPSMATRSSGSALNS